MYVYTYTCVSTDICIYLYISISHVLETKTAKDAQRSVLGSLIQGPEASHTSNLDLGWPRSRRREAPTYQTRAIRNHGWRPAVDAPSGNLSIVLDQNLG